MKPLPTLAALGTGLLAAAAWPAEPQVIAVRPLATAPAVDGDLKEWGREGWTRVPIKPAIDRADRAKLGLDGEDRNRTGSIVVEIKAGVADARLFLAARWPDDAADTDYKGWEWAGSRYVEGKRRDDMFAVRFHLDGDFDRSMLSAKTYRVDVWQWSAGRSNPGGFADDAVHLLTTRLVENAAEFQVAGIGTVYVKRQRDEGSPAYKLVRPPKAQAAERLPAIETATPSGSAADVAGKGAWKAGHWQLELARTLATGNADDVAFKPGLRILGQIAVWNRASDDHKSISEPLMFDFSGLK